MTPVVRIKPGVTLDPLTPACARLIGALDHAAQIIGRDLTVTCGREGHTDLDPHTDGRAIDVRTIGFADGTILALVQYLKKHLGPAFTVLYEVPDKPSGVLAGLAYVNPRATAAHLHLQVKRGTEFPESEREIRA